jgi:hypothetical protein
MLQKIRALPQSIKLVLACLICLAFGVLIVGLVEWLS